MKKPKKKRRPNPLKARGKRRPRRSDPLGHLAADRRRLLPPDEAPIMQDPIFLHHVASAILRYLRLKHPAEIYSALILESDQQIDAEFLKGGEPVK